MLYLPPGVPHHGVALGECMTYSVGMRAPSQAELLLDFAETLAEALPEELRFCDADLRRRTVMARSMTRHSSGCSGDALAEGRAFRPEKKKRVGKTDGCSGEVDSSLLRTWFPPLHHALSQCSHGDATRPTPPRRCVQSRVCPICAGRAQSLVARGVAARRPRRCTVRGRRRARLLDPFRAARRIARADSARSREEPAGPRRAAQPDRSRSCHAARVDAGAADDSRGFPRRARRLDHRLDALRTVRDQVFIDEQNVPIEDEIDALDTRARVT